MRQKLKNRKIVFLHYGPGAHSLVEKEVYNERWSFINQKKVSECLNFPEKTYIECLVDQHEVELRLILETEDDVAVVAHSFGAYILNQLPSELVKSFSQIHLITPTFDFLRSMKNMFEANVDISDSSMTSSLRKLNRETGPVLFWNFFNKFNEKHPDYLSSYFSNQSAYKSYTEVASKFSGLDMDSAIQAVNELLEKDICEVKLSQLKNLTLHFGKADPLIPLEYQEELTRVFKSSKVQLYNGGHFPHLEETIQF